MTAPTKPPNGERTRRADAGRSPLDYDIVIVGGGPAGLSTWLHLHAVAPELAARTVLIEKATYPRDKPCGGAITPLGVLLLHGLGITLSIPVLPVHTVEFRCGAQTVPLRRPNALLIVRRSEFDHALALAAVERGLTLRQEEAFRTMRREGDHLLIGTSRAEYRTRVLVGADGAYSAVRRQMALAPEPPLARLLKLVTPADPQRDPEFASRTAVFDFSPVARGLQGYVWHFPCVEHGAAAMDRGIYDSGVHAERPRADVKAIFSRALEARQIVPEAGAIGHPLRGFSEAGIFSQPNILLVGEAAGVDPALGEGISPSLDYGDLAANTLVAAFGGNDFSLADYRSRLLAHPVGQSLAARARLAQTLYASEADVLRNMEHLLTGWLS